MPRRTVLAVLAITYFGFAAYAAISTVGDASDYQSQKAAEPNQNNAIASPTGGWMVAADPKQADGDAWANNEKNQRGNKRPDWLRSFVAFIERHDKFWVAAGTIVIAAFTVALAVSTILLWLTTRNAAAAQARDMKVSLRLAREASESAEKALLVSERPWLSADLTLREDGLLIEGDKIRVIIVLELWNFGRSPAVDLEIETAFCPLDIDTRRVLRSMCQKARMGEDADRRWRVSKPIYPKTRVDPDPVIPVTAYSDAIKDVVKGWADPKIDPAIIGCITYKSPFSEERLQTAFIYELRRRYPEQPNVLYPFDVDSNGNILAGSLPATHLSLEEVFESGSII